MSSYQYRKSHCGDKTVVSLISTMRFPILVRCYLHIESGPWSFAENFAVLVMVSTSAALLVVVMTGFIIRTSFGRNYLGGNITSIPPEAWPGDPTLDMRYISISHIPVDAFISYSNLKRITFIHLDLQYIEEGAFRGQDKLEDMTIIDNGRTLILPPNLGPPTGSLISIILWQTLADETATVYPYFKAFEKLKSLNIGGNNLKKFDVHVPPKNLTTISVAVSVIPIFPNLGSYTPLLQSIEMRYCGMNVISAQNVTGLTNVKYLQLYGNRLPNLPDISFMKHLEHLLLHSNRLTSMPDLYELPLITLTLAKNPLVCDKALCWIRMWPWMKASTILTDEPICAGPAAMVGMKLMEVNPALMECFEGEFLHNTQLHLSLPNAQGPLWLTWINFNPSMDK